MTSHRRMLDAYLSGIGLQPAGSPANWRCLALEKLSRLLEDAWAHSTQPLPPGFLRDRCRY